MRKANQKKFRVEKVINRKRGKVNVKWKDYYNSFNSWINKKDIVIQNKLFSKTIYPY